MKIFIKKYWLAGLGILVGMAAGYLYWRFAGCSSGGCAITSSPINSSLWGGGMGGLLLSIFIPSGKKKKEDKNRIS